MRTRNYFFALVFSVIAIAGIAFFGYNSITGNVVANFAPGEIKFAIFGDSAYDGSNDAAITGVADLMKGWNPEFIITSGDNCYSGYAFDRCIGKYFHEFIYPYSGTYGAGSPDLQNRFFPTLGNHDFDAGEQNYYNFFTLPASAEGGERYYNFTKGPVEFFMLDSYHSDGRGATSVQALWLKDKLSKSTAKWKIVVFHNPPYTSGTNHPSDTAMQWPFAQWGATAVVAGHNHQYERINRDSIVYFVNGSGGRHLYGFGTPVTGSQSRVSEFGAQLVEASDTAIVFKFMNSSGVLKDTYTITAGCGNGFCDAGETCSSCAGDCVCGGGNICCGGVCRAPSCSGASGCSDSNSCTVDVCNAAGTCSASCSHAAITGCVNGDGCCPSACSSGNDSDCAARCGNGFCDVGETCSSCSGDCVCGSGNICCGSSCIAPICTLSTGCSAGRQCISPSTCSAVCRDVNCGQGAIPTSGCYCGGQVWSSGYCCNNIHQTTPCAALCGGATCTAVQLCCNNSCTIPACTADANCQVGQRCVSPGVCAAACQNIQCSEGQITSACYCASLPKTTGYCCNGTYRATVCSTDANCNDNNATTKDTCTSPASCAAACTHTTITQCINNDSYCPPTCTNATDNDCLASCGNTIPDSGENCSNCPADVKCSSAQICCAGACITPECTIDANCSSGQHCTSSNPCTGQCADCDVNCSSNAQCNDSDTTTIDTCENPASCESYCKNEPVTCGGVVCQTGQICCNNTCTTPACTTTSQCDDSDACTRDSCATAGTCTAQCLHTAIPKCGWKKMAWTTPSCFPIAALFAITLKDETGAPLGEVEITYGTQKMFTSAEGKVEMLGEKSQYTINAAKEGYYPLTARKLASATCKPAYTTTGTPTTAKGKIEIEVLETPYVGREFSIKITDNNGQPLQGATVTYSNQTTETNEQGQATLNGEKSKYTITVASAQGTATARILPKTFAQPDQNTGTGAGTPKPFTMPLDIIALAAVVIVGVIVLLRARVSNKKAPVA